MNTDAETEARRVYAFQPGLVHGDASATDTLGGKGANLAEMTRLGLPVPPGFTIATSECRAYLDQGNVPAGLMDEVRLAMTRLEESTGKRFGVNDRPLLVSVRSGAPISMPGMMDTVLNLGLNADVRDALEEQSGSARFARDSHRRFIEMFANVVEGVHDVLFHDVLEGVKRSAGVAHDHELDARALDKVIEGYLQVWAHEIGGPFPDDPYEQLERAITAVFRSWNTKRARDYRRANRVPDTMGTAVNVQTMVFGNLGDDCCSGVAFTRDTATGAPNFNGEFLRNAQGEDVVSGKRTPIPLHEDRADAAGLAERSLEHCFPEQFAELLDLGKKLETHYGDVQDLEFTVEHDRLFMLQTRRAKRTGASWLRTLTALVDDGLITREQAIDRIPDDALEQILAPGLDDGTAKAAVADGRRLGSGLGASPGAATGKVVRTADEAARRAALGEDVILVREETSPDDFHGMVASVGILTARGGKTSHAALVARGMGTPAVVGCGDLHVHEGDFVLGARTLSEDDVITLDGTTGAIFAGALPVHPSEVMKALLEPDPAAEPSPLLEAYTRLMGWCDEVRRLRVRTNADNPKDSATAVALGAEGIGLTRTEHMFAAPDRVLAVRKMIFAEDAAERAAALSEIEPMQRADFAGIFRAMEGRPVTIRTLDPPLHEFLPHSEEELDALAAAIGSDVELVRDRAASMRESNPMLGFRGCRLGTLVPEITLMQSRAILRAAVEVASDGIEVHPEIMIPLVGHVGELRGQRQLVVDAAEEVFADAGQRVPFKIGTMIEVPRAALTAGEIATEAEFFSFGTNDLTQMCLGVSRDDAGSFLPAYGALGIYPVDPFVSVDLSGVGRLMELAVTEGRAARPDIKLGICGEHGGDPDSVRFCHRLGLDYVSCSPPRVPVARLASAQAAIRHR